MNKIATIIVTDNPVIRYYVWMLDMMWQYWYVTVALCVVAVWIIGWYFARRQREWDDYMNREREKFDEFKRKVEMKHAAERKKADKYYVWNHRDNEYPFSGTLEECEAYMKQHFPTGMDACILP